MLTTTPRLPHDLQHRRTTAYRCNATAFTPLGPRCWLGSHTATTPRLALRWLRTRAQHIADQLHPAQAQPVRHWLTDHAEHEHALARLVDGTSYTFTLHEEATGYALTATPVPAPSARRHSS